MTCILAGTFLAQAAAELEALCAESLGLATPIPLGSAPSMAPQRSKPSIHEHKQMPPQKNPPQKPAQQVSLAKGRPVKSALQKAEELLARLTEEAAAWDNTACSAAERQPASKEQQPGKSSVLEPAIVGADALHVCHVSRSLS